MPRKLKLDPVFVAKIWDTDPYKQYRPYSCRREFVSRDALGNIEIIAYFDRLNHLNWKTVLTWKVQIPSNHYTDIKILRRATLVTLIKQVGTLLTHNQISDTDAEILLDLLNAELLKRLGKPK